LVSAIDLNKGGFRSHQQAIGESRNDLALPVQMNTDLIRTVD
jgi:hypothetical protein